MKGRNAWVSNPVGPKIPKVKNHTCVWQVVQGTSWSIMLGWDWWASTPAQELCMAPHPEGGLKSGH